MRSLFLICGRGCGLPIWAGSAIHHYQKVLLPHLKMVFHKVETQQREKDALISLSNAVVDIGLGFVPGGNILGSLNNTHKARANSSSSSLGE